MACKLLSAASALILAVGIYGCALEEPARPSMEQRRIPQLAEYRIGPDDELLVTVWKDETLTRTVPVRPDGMISLPLLNDVQAAGLTPAELREVLKKKLMPYMSDPQVSVIVQKVSSFKVSVMGEVKKPGSYEITGQNTVLDALAKAEGLTEWASKSRIVVIRNEAGTTKRFPFNYNRAISDGENIYLRPGDIVVVP